MKKFGIHILWFIALPLALVVLLFNTSMALFLNEAEPVYELVATADKLPLNTRTLLLGDSVCREFFEEKKNDSVYCLCENQSYEVPGNYLLLKSLLSNGSRFKKLILIINPRTLTASLNQNYTFNYFVKPFRNHLSNLDADELRYIESSFPSSDVLKYRFSNYELPNAYDIYESNDQDSLRISDLNRKYLLKIDAICKANKIEFSMICPPLPKSTATYLENFDSENRKEFNSYFDSVIYYDSLHSKDGLHHIDSDQYIAKNKAKLDSLLNR